MRKGLANATSSHWNVDDSEVTSPWPSKFSKLKLAFTRLTSSSAHPKPGYEDCEILEQTPRTSSVVTLSICFQRTVIPSMVRNLPCSTCVTSVPIHCQFSQYCYHRLLMFFFNTQSPPLVCGYYWPSWPFLPLLNK